MADSTDSPHRSGYRDVDTSGQEWGSDLVADVLKGYGFEYVSFNPGSSIRGLEESLVNYNDDVPKTIEVLNEGLTVSIAHGYAKATGEPAVCAMHGVVGTLNGAMGIYAAYIDRAPIVILGGNGGLRKSQRRPVSDWDHTHLNQGELVSDYVKWFDQPVHSDGVVGSLARGVRIADTPRKGPVFISLDHAVQENQLEEPFDLPDLSKFESNAPLAPDADSIEEAAERLVAADNPAILTSFVGDSREAVDALVELADTLGAPVVEDFGRKRFNFPNTHPLYIESVADLEDVDLLLALDVRDLNYLVTESDTVTHEKESLLDGDPALIDIGLQDLESPSNIPDYFELQEADLSILADTGIAIPALTGAVETRLRSNDAARARAEARRERYAELHEEQRAEWKRIAAEAWDEEPISVPRLAGDLWDVVRDDNWVIVCGHLRGWPHRLWEIDDFDQYVHGKNGGGGVGYRTGVAIGAALAYQDTDRVPIHLQTDGDLTQVPSSLWTIAHYDIPMLVVVHNNRSLYNSTNHRIVTADHRGRDDSYERALVGTGIWDPVPDFATIAEGFGVTGYGPVEDPDDLAPTLATAWEDVKAGDPALVDVISQPR